MGVERRGGKVYYYRKVKRNGKVTSEYLGHGPVAEAVAARERHRRERESLRREEAEADLAERTAGSAEVGRACEQAEAVAAALLILAGFHRHDRGEWRRRRGGD